MDQFLSSENYGHILIHNKIRYRSNRVCFHLRFIIEGRVLWFYSEEGDESKGKSDSSHVSLGQWAGVPLVPLVPLFH